MSMKRMKPMNMMSSFSNREKMRQKPLRRRKRRSTSLRRLYRRRSYSQGSKRFDFGGTTGVKPNDMTFFASFVSFVSLVHDDRGAIQQHVKWRSIGTTTPFTCASKMSISTTSCLVEISAGDCGRSDCSSRYATMTARAKAVSCASETTMKFESFGMFEVSEIAVRSD